MLSKRSDEELMISYQLGEASSFDELYQRYSGQVLGYLRRKATNEASAQDLFQSTFLKVHKYRSRYNASMPFAPWLFTICRNELFDSFKRSSAKNETLVAAVDEPTTVVAAPELDLDLSGLPDAQRRALELRYSNDFSFEEIAKSLSTSPANARQLVSRAIRSLRGLYGRK